MRSKEVTDEELLVQAAKVLNVPAEAIKNLDEESAINIISILAIAIATIILHFIQVS